MLTGLTAIIVEDNYLVARSLALLLESLGCEVAGMAANVRKGSDLAGTADFDVAILDISLGDNLVTEVARKVEERGKRIVYLTGFAGADLLPEELRAYPCLPKPVQTNVLVEALLRK